MFTIAIAGVTTTLQAQDEMRLEDILKNHFEVIGQEKLSKVENMKITGKVIVNGGLMELPMTAYVSRSGGFKSESTFQGQTVIQAYDNIADVAWMANPFMGSKDPQKMPEDQSKRMKRQADMDGMLYNYKEKGYTVELEGKEDFEGTPIYKIKITTEEGETHRHYMDAENFVVIKTESKVIEQGNEIETVTFLSNYKEVQGIISPFSMETQVGGKTVTELVFETVEWDADITDDVFAMPETTSQDPHAGHDHEGHDHATDVKDATQKACGADCTKGLLCCKSKKLWRKKACSPGCEKACCAPKEGAAIGKNDRGRRRNEKKPVEQTVLKPVVLQKQKLWRKKPVARIVKKPVALLKKERPLEKRQRSPEKRKKPVEQTVLKPAVLQKQKLWRKKPVARIVKKACLRS